MYVEITYYDGDKYISGDGTVIEVKADGCLKVLFENAEDSTEIGYADIYDIEI